MRPGSLHRQLGLFQRAPSFRLLSLSALGSGLGTWLAFVALAVDVFDRTGSGAWVSALLIADFLPAVVIGLTLGPMVDRLSRRGLMIAADLARAAVFCALPFVGSAAAIVALAAVAGFATGFFRPAVYAGLPNLVADEDLPAANSLLQTIENVTLTVGPVVGGLLVAASGPHLAYWLNAVTFVISAALISRVPGRLLQAAEISSEGHLRDVVAGFRLVLSTRALLTVLIAWNVVMVANAGINVAEVVLAKVSFHSGDFGFGLLVGAAGLGLAVGSLGAAQSLERRGIAVVYAGSIGLMAIGIGVAAGAPNVWVAAASVVISGAGNGAAVVCNALLVQRAVPDHLRGRAFTVLMSSNFAVLGLGMIVAGRVTDAVGARWVWGGAAVISAVGAVTAYALARGIREQRRETHLELHPLPAVAETAAASTDRPL